MKDKFDESTIEEMCENANVLLACLKAKNIISKRKQEKDKEKDSRGDKK